MANYKRTLDDDEIRRYLQEVSNNFEAPSDSDLSILGSDDEQDEDEFTRKEKEELLEFNANEAEDITYNEDRYQENKADDQSMSKMPEDIFQDDTEIAQAIVINNDVMFNYAIESTADHTINLPDDTCVPEEYPEIEPDGQTREINNFELLKDAIEITDLVNQTFEAGNTYVMDLRRLQIKNTDTNLPSLQSQNTDHSYSNKYLPVTETNLLSTSSSRTQLFSTNLPNQRKPKRRSCKTTTAIPITETNLPSTSSSSTPLFSTSLPNKRKTKMQSSKTTGAIQKKSKNKNELSKTSKNEVKSGKKTEKKKDPATWFPGKDNNFTNDVPPFLGEESVNIDGDTPADFFSQLFPDEIYDLIVTESIRYSLEKGKNNFRLNKADLKVYIGINIIMTYIKYPQSRMYWSSISALRMDLIADTMSVNRFEEIKRYLHFVDNAEKEDLKKDKFWKIRPIADILHRTFHESKSEEENQSVDEMIVPFKGRNSLKQYLKKKPKKWGFKIWVKAGASGYVNCFELYQGASQTTRSALGPTADALVRVCHDIEGKNHKLFMDNFFTTLALVRHLQNKGILVLGTVQMNRVPDEAKGHLVDPDLLPRGASSIVTRSDNISIVRWMDNNAVHTISTYAGVEPADVAERWDKITKQRLEVPRPFSIQQYNMFMGGVDLVDRMIAHYPHGFKNKRWYLRVFFHLMNVAIVNAWHLYKLKKGTPKYTLLAFKASLANSLISSAITKKRGRPSEENMLSVKKRTAPPKSSLEVRYDGVNHYPKKTQGKQAARCHDKYCKSRTRYVCDKCDEPVCPDCMERFHTK